MISYFINFSGDEFFPRKLSLINALDIVAIHDPGEYSKTLTGKVYDYGRLRISGNSINCLLNDASKIINETGNLINDIELNIIYLYKSQCNIEVSPDEIKNMAKLGVALTISCDRM